MANYIPMARSNYFRVKDVEAFKQFIEDVGLEPIESLHEATGETLWGFMDESGEIGIPVYNRATDSDIDFPTELAAHLVAGEVAVIIEIGWEKYRYLVGQAIAVNSAGMTSVVTLQDIYEQAKALGELKTLAEF